MTIIDGLVAERRVFPMLFDPGRIDEVMRVPNEFSDLFRPVGNAVGLE
jgi:hypothetical protein